MKAIGKAARMLAVVQESFAEPVQSVAVRDRSPGELQTGQVLVEMLASPVNPSDLMTLRGGYGRLPDLPAVPGYEGVGIVRKAAAGLYGRWLVGQRVAVICPTGGAWAEQFIASARQVIPLPRTLSVEQGSMFFVNPATAWLMTRSVLAIPRGAWLLQTAAASAVGRMIVRLGRETGFRTLNVVRREDQAEQLRREGLPDDSRVIVFDGSIDARDLLREEVLRHTADGISFAVDPVGGATASAVVPCLGRGGRLLLYGTLSPDLLEISPRDLMTPGASIEGFWLSNAMARIGFPSRLRLIRTLGRLIQSGVLSAEVAESFPLQRIHDALRAAEEPGRRGKVLLRLSGT